MERGFLRKHAKTVLRDWKVALIELVSNAWDAGSTRLLIILPKTPNEFLTMEDNGIGLSKIEFEERWPKLYYDRVEHQGTKVQFPDGLNLNRMAHGKRGLGRHACFFFDSQYFVQASKNGGLCLFSIKENDVTFDIQMLKESVIAPPNHGLKICFKLKTILSLTPKSVTDLIGSKFLADPNFEIFVNGEKINPFDFKKKEKYEIPTKYGPITIYFVES